MTALLLLLACRPVKDLDRAAAQLDLAEEVPVQLLSLEGEAAQADMEFSGMTWLGEHVLGLLPQYPRCGEDGDEACLYMIEADELADAVDHGAALTPAALPITMGALADKIPGFQGFEAITVAGQEAWVSVEADDGGEMSAWLVPGRLDRDGLHLDPDAAVRLDPAVQLANRSIETLFQWGGQICGLDETNGPTLNEAPRAQCVDRDLEPSAEPPTAPLAFRLTDATEPDDADRIWVTNFQYEGSSVTEPAIDAQMQRWGVGPTHAQTANVERLVQLQLTEGGVEFTNTAPVTLALDDNGDARNWEGVARFGDGLLVVTDKFPATLLGYVPLPGD